MAEETSGRRLEQAAALLGALDRGDDAAARRALAALGYRGEHDLYLRIGSLARQVHEAIGEIEGDALPMSLADATLPDPRERLQLIIDKTGQASHDTLDLIESLAPVPARILVGANKLSAQGVEAASPDGCAERRQALADYLDTLRVDADRIAAGLTSITVAQELQDATGQISRRAVALIEDVERQLVEIVQLAGDAQVNDAEAGGGNDGRPRNASEGQYDGNTDSNTDSRNGSGTGRRGKRKAGARAKGNAGAQAPGNDDVAAVLASLGF